MSNRDLVKNLVDQVPGGKLVFIILYFQEAAISDETSNTETLEAFAELENGDGHIFTGGTEALIKELAED